jgi:acyl carrier protein|tara:strand:- start:756 stop:986 length:231 start_codon:yes stop_codon:yes gene_type:complete
MSKLEDKVITKISKILDVKKNELIKIDNFLKLENWDSLKHLEVITELDKLLGNKIKNIKDFSKLTSLKKILSLIKK